MQMYQPKEFEERVVSTKRVSKKTKGGNTPSFTALVVVGNKKGTVGVGLGKARNVAGAIQKGIKVAKDNMIEVSLVNDTVPHEITQKYKAAIIKIMPAPKGSGVIAGGPVRHVMELAGVKNVSAKLLGSSDKTCTVRCALLALSNLQNVSDVSK